MKASTTLSLQVNRIRELTPRIRAYELRSSTATELPLVTAGSQLSVPIQLNTGKTENRNYFICSDPYQRDFYEIAVSREQNDTNSELTFGKITEGTLLEGVTITNNFHPHADASPAILIAGEIGIAPMLAIAHTLTARGRRFSLHYAGQNQIDMAFVDELKNNFSRYVHFYIAEENQHLDILHLLAEAPGNTLFYACGPQEMLNEIETSARMLGIAKDRIQKEYFIDEKQLSDKGVILELAYSDKLINTKPDQPLLAALRDAGVDVNFDCCVGDCGTCAVKVLEGQPDHRDHILSDAQKAQGFMCVCVSRALTEKLVLAL